VNGAHVTQWLGKLNVSKCKIVQFVGKTWRNVWTLTGL